MHIFYIDDSRDEEICIFSALSFPGESWKEAFTRVKDFRKELKASDGIYVRKEFHATDFVGGRSAIADKTIFKGRRCEIFKQTLAMTAELPGASLINVCLPADKENWAFERLLNRINTAMVKSDSHAVVICDQGKDLIYGRIARKLGVFNMIPSLFGTWKEGEETKNIPTERILEDIIFKDSRRSYFIQLADFCAYALLRKEHRLPSKDKYGLHEAFQLLYPILNRNASYKDPEGIVRL